MSRFGRILCTAAWAALLTAGPGFRPAWAQIRRLDGGVDQQPSRVQPFSDRVATRGIRRAEEAIAAGQYSQAIQYLDGVLASDEDKFVDVDKQGGYAGLKERARQLIRDLPAEGRRAYETAFSAAAARLLQQAIETGDAATLQAVARRYFYTPAGYDAAFLLAMDEADAGRHLSAALNYQHLLEAPEAVERFDPHLSLRAAASWLAAGDDARAHEVLDALLGRGHHTVQVAGRQHRLDSPSQSLSWLRNTVGELGVADKTQSQWLTYRGNAARNSESAGGLPHMRVRWKVRLLGHPQLESLYENFVAELTRTGNMAPIAAAPLAAGDYILARTPHGLLAVDFRTGKRIWRSEPQDDPQLAVLMRSGASTEEEANPEPARAFARRMWEDHLYGLMSSDGARVYMIQDLPMPTTNEYEMSPWGAPPISDRGQTNRLSAYELATQGKLVWEIDGAVAKGELAGAFFLGAPLHVGESLYVLAEIKSGVYLVALDRETGEFQWSQGLAELETGVVLDARRRLQSAMPSYAAGVLVCPTGAGVVVGVDLAKRSLAWAYQYEVAATPSPRYRGRDDDSTAALARRWQDSAATLVGDRVLFTPPDSEELHVIDLRSGRLLWKQPRGEMTRIGFADDQRVLLVGNRRLKSLRLEDGKPAWKKESLTLPRGVSPSGTGFVSDGKYFLPLTSAEVIAVDLADGKIVSRATARDGAPLGNLICHRGAVISQNGLFLDCFDQIDELRRRSEERLAEQPGDVQALRTLGEIAYNEGRLSDAIALLERAFRADAHDVEVRDVLAECLAAALDEDFASHRSKLPLLKELNDGGVARRMLILRIEAQGLLGEGDALASSAACLELYRLASAPDEMLELGREHQATVSRWVQAQLAAIWKQADDGERRELQTQLEREAETLGDNPGGDSLARFLRFIGELPMFESLKLARARELTSRDSWLEAQQILLDLEGSADEQMSHEATARIARQLHDGGLHSLAAGYDAKLMAAGDAKVLDGIAANEWIAKWASPDAGDPVRDWPRGKVKVATAPTTGAAANARVRSPLWGVRLERTDSILGHSTVQLSARGGEIVLHDSLGREFFSTNLEPDSQINYRQPGAVYGVSRGNLLVVSLGRQIAAVNTLATSDGLAPPVMWRVGLGSSFDYTRGLYAEPAGEPGARRPGSYRAPRPTDEGKWIGVIGPVTSRGVVFQDQRRLMCVDALSGDLRWSRTDAPQGCDLFGDEQYVFAVPTGSTTGRVYNAIDGRYVGKRKVPEWREQLVTRGREILCWKSTADAVELSSLDAFTGETAWRHEFEPGSAVDVEMGRYVAVVEPGGRVIVVDGADGKKVVDYATADVPVVDEVHLAVGKHDFLITVKRPRPGNADRRVRPYNMLDSPVIDGEVYLFDRETGEMRWSRPAEVVQHALLLTQPVDLPFIAFAGLLTRNDGGGSRAITTMLILDKATGRTLFQSDELPQTGGGHCVARVTDAVNHQAAVEMAGQTILLQFTEERRPPEPPAMAEVESSAGKSSDGLMGIFRNLGVGR